MKSGAVKISLATGFHARARPLWEGRVRSQRLELEVVPFGNDGERHRRFLQGEFQAAEFSLALYLALRSRGESLIAIPVFPNRRFRHAYIYTRKGDGPKRPEDLRGRPVGVPHYLNTCGLWVRGVLNDEYGVKTAEVQWKTLKREPIPFVPPPDVPVEILGGKKDLRSRLLEGEVEAVITPDILEGEATQRLFTDAKQVEKQYYLKTGIFPISHAVVIREETLQRHSWVAQELFRMWDLAKEISLEDDADPTYSNFAWIRTLWEEERGLFGARPWPYGVKENEKAIATVIRYAAEQGMIGNKVSPDSLFTPHHSLPANKPPNAPAGMGST